MVTETIPQLDETSALDDYLRFGSDEELSKGEKTRQAYLYTIGLFRKFLDGRELTPELGKGFLRTFEEKGNSPASINRHIWALKSYFRFKDKEFKLRGLKTVEYIPRYLRDEEWDKLLEVATSPMYDPSLPDAARLRAKKELALLWAYCGAGLRLSEAVNMRNEDILDEGYVRVIGKGSREKFVPIELEPLVAIKEYIQVKGQNGRYIFSGEKYDTPMAPRTAQGIIKNLCRRAGLPDVHVHTLRHTLGYKMRKAGSPERDIQDVLRHKNISTTRIYTHLAQEELKRRLPKLFAQVRQGRLEWPTPKMETRG